MRWRREGSAKPGSFGPTIDGWLDDASVPGQQWKFYALFSVAGAIFAGLWALGLWAFEKVIGKRPRWT